MIYALLRQRAFMRAARTVAADARSMLSLLLPIFLRQSSKPPLYSC